MAITLNGSTGIANDGGYTGDGVSFADTTPANTLVTTTGGNVGVGTSNPSYKLQVTGSGGTSSAVKDTTATGSSSYSNFRLEAGSTAANILLGNGSLAVYGGANSLNLVANDGPICFFPNGAGSSNTERMRIDSSGNLLVGTTTSIGKVRINGVSSNYGLFFSGYGGGVGYGAGFRPLTANADPITFENDSGTRVGGVSTSASATTYATSSDYRLKENIAPMTGALATVAALKPVTYKWKVDGSEGQGFIAHELQEVVPDCVTGEKDAVDKEGNPRYQGIDTSFLVATLTAAIQEQTAIIQSQADTITAMEARLTALEQA